jgi:hypothetical protein
MEWERSITLDTWHCSRWWKFFFQSHDQSIHTTCSDYLIEKSSFEWRDVMNGRKLSLCSRMSITWYLTNQSSSASSLDRYSYSGVVFSPFRRSRERERERGQGKQVLWTLSKMDGTPRWPYFFWNRPFAMLLLNWYYLRLEPVVIPCDIRSIVVVRMSRQDKWDLTDKGEEGVTLQSRETCLYLFFV